MMFRIVGDVMDLNWKLVLIACLAAIFVRPDLKAQDRDSIRLPDAISVIEIRERVNFFFEPGWVSEINVERALADKSLKDFLSELNAMGLSLTPLHEGKYIVLTRSAPPRIVTLTGSQGPGDALPIERSDVFVIHGVVTDAETAEPLPGAAVVIAEPKVGATTNTDGRFTFNLPAGVYDLRVTAVGKLATTQRVVLDADLSLDLEMFEEATQLDNVTISSESMTRNVTSTGMSQINLDIKTMKSIPPFLGEPDVIKSILLLPGVSTVGEGASGFNVRGGNVDQNLILLDDTPLYNSSHLFGFFSAFNPDFVRDVTLYKGGMPSNFGGRISSVLDIGLKDGNSEKLKGAGGIGIVTSRLLFEGPLGSDKTTFMIGGRIAYPNWMIRSVPDINVSQSSGSFYDANVRLRHQFNDKNTLHISAYRSDDDFKFAADTTYGWTTTNLSLKWSTTISPRLFGSTTLLYTDYENHVTGIKPTFEFESNFGVLDLGGKIDFSWLPDKRNRVDFGLSYTNHTFHNPSLIAAENSVMNGIYIPDEQSIEQGYYISDELKITEGISLEAGVRFSLYSAIGPASVYQFNPDLPRRISTIIDTLHFEAGDKIQSYSGWEPRASLKIATGDRSSVKLSYNRNFQYIHLISNTTAVTPLDLWKSSGYNIKPQFGSQVAAGYFVNLRDNLFELSFESYYKRTNNLLEYRDGATLFMNPYLEAELLTAKGWSYGVESMVRKNRGKLTGWLAYTYSRSMRQVDGTNSQEVINFGKPYPSNFDKPHDVTFVGRYAFTKRLSISANFTYATGRPTTSPQSVYVVNGYSFAQYSQRNQARIPDYHRLDLSFSIDESLKHTRKWKGNWTFSLYNVYGRKNAYSVFFRPQYRGAQTQSYRLAVVGTLLPSITYNFRF
jgi:hypothetical protein